MYTVLLAGPGHQCSICGQGFDDFQQRVEHETEECDFQNQITQAANCTVCGATCETLLAVTDHMRRAHYQTQYISSLDDVDDVEDILQPAGQHNLNDFVQAGVDTGIDQHLNGFAQAGLATGIEQHLNGIVQAGLATGIDQHMNGIAPSVVATEQNVINGNHPV